MDPNNQLAVEIYHYAREDQRIGLFDWAPLTRTITITGVCKILDEFAVYFPTWLHRQNTLTKVFIIDQVATNIRYSEEERRKASRDAAARAAQETSRENRGR